MDFFIFCWNCNELKHLTSYLPYLNNAQKYIFFKWTNWDDGTVQNVGDRLYESFTKLRKFEVSWRTCSFSEWDKRVTSLSTNLTTPSVFNNTFVKISTQEGVKRWPIDNLCTHSGADPILGFMCNTLELVGLKYDSICWWDWGRNSLLVRHAVTTRWWFTWIEWSIFSGIQFSILKSPNGNGCLVSMLFTQRCASKAHLKRIKRKLNRMFQSEGSVSTIQIIATVQSSDFFMGKLVPMEKWWKKGLSVTSRRSRSFSHLHSIFGF